MSIFYRKYQNKNKNQKTFGWWYGRAVTLGKTYTLDDLAKHMAEHNTPYSAGAIKGVLTDMVTCIRELVLEGKAVKLPNLAIFSAGVQSTGAPSSDEFSVQKNIKSVYMRARATGDFTRDELTKSGSVTELPKNYTDYQDAGDGTDGEGEEDKGGGSEMPPTGGY